MSMQPSQSPLERALRSLPEVTGHDDWHSLERQLKQLRPNHGQRRRVRRIRIFSGVLSLVLLVTLSTFWLFQSPSQVAVNDDLNDWMQAHQETKSDETQTWDDPWVAVASETSP